MDDVSMAPGVLSIQLLKEITRNFSKDWILGVGSYGKVYKGQHTNGEMIAVKVLHYISELDDEQFKKEYCNLASLQHKNIVRLVGYCNETQRKFVIHEGESVLSEMTQRALCFEYLQNGSLDSFLSDESGGLDWRTRYAIIKGICQGLKYLHEELDSPMYHLDLKPANVLLDEKMVPKIADFGLSRLFGGEKTQIIRSPIGTHGYLPPEYIDAAIVSIKFDIYSLGVVIIKIITGPTGYFRSAEMSPQQFTELVHANWKNKLQKTSIFTWERDSDQVKRCIEIALSCIDADRHRRPSTGVIINRLNETETAIVNVQGMRSMPMRNEPGRVQLAIRNNERAPLNECNIKLMLELTGCDSNNDRPGLDLVAVLDASNSMVGEKMDQLKTAMRFVIRKLSRIDRLSIVTFSSSSKKLCPLRQITEASQRVLQELIEGINAFGGTTNIKAGLLTGLKVLADRKVSDGRVAAIMLLCSYRENTGKATEVCVGDVPVYTFGFGNEFNHTFGNDRNDTMLSLSTVASNSLGGTFSHIKNEDIYSGSLTMAFSQCLAGLLTVSVQDLELTVAPVRDESRIRKVTAGTYPQAQEKGAEDLGGSVTVRFGSLYSREVRRVIVDVLVPAIESERSANILEVTYSHKSSSSGCWQQFVAPRETLTVWRTGVDDVLDLEEEKPLELQREEARLQTAKLIEEARIISPYYHPQRIGKLVEAQNMLLEQSNSNPLLRTELHDLLELSDQQFLYPSQWKGLYYALSSASAHGRQRFAARGNMQVMRLFATPRMDMYLEQTYKFLDDPAMLLLSSLDDEVNEEVFIASREEEMQRLNLEMED